MLSMATSLSIPDAGVATMEATYLPGTEATAKTPRAKTTAVIGKHPLRIRGNTPDLSTLLTLWAAHIDAFSKVFKGLSRVCKGRHALCSPLSKSDEAQDY